MVAKEKSKMREKQSIFSFKPAAMWAMGLFAIVMVMSAGSVHAATINVTTAPELVTASNTAVAGDTVVLAAGTYLQHVTFTVPVFLTSGANMPPFPTIDGQVRFRVVGGTVNVSRLQFTNITNPLDPATGLFSENQGTACGVHIVGSTGSTFLIDNCVFFQNAQSGVLINSSTTNVTVQNSTLNENGRRGVRFAGATLSPFGNGARRGTNVIVHNCSIARNGTTHGVTNNERGRTIEMQGLTNGSLTVTDSDLAVTLDGVNDRCIQFDQNTGLLGTDLTVTGTTLTAPLYDELTLMGNREGIAFKTRARSSNMTVDNCTVVGFRHAGEFKNDSLPGNGNAFGANISVRNCSFTDFRNGRGMIISEIGGGTILVENVTLRGKPGLKPFGGDEALRLQENENATITVRNIDCSNAEELITLDESGGATATFENVNLHRDFGDGDSGFKIQENPNIVVTIDGGIVDNCENGLDCMDNGSDQTINVSGLRIEDSSQSILYRPDAGTTNNVLNVTSTVFLRTGLSGGSDPAGIQVQGGAGVNPGSINVSFCNFHDNPRHGIRTSSASVAPINVTYSIFSEWGDLGGTALTDNNAADGLMTENFNVFVDPSGNGIYGGAGAANIVQGGGSRTAAQLVDVFCNTDENSSEFLFIRADGLASMIDGTNNAGSKAACFTSADVNNWSIYQ